MANPYDVAVPNIYQSLMAGEQSYKGAREERKNNQISAVREEAARGLMTGGDTRSAIAKLIGIGDIQGAHTLASLGQNERDFQFRTQEAQRAQKNADRSFGLQQQTANTAQIVTTEDASGNKTPIRVDRNGNVTALNIPGQGGQSGNPFAYGKQNETQSKDSGYANRMFRAEGVLREPGVESAATNLWENTKGMAPGFAANYLTSSDYQKFDQAKRDFVNAVLRRESGAAISASEFDNATKQYFPQPGDSKEKIAEKRRNRQDAIAGVAGGGGQHYKPPFTFDQAGGMVPSGNAQQGVVKSAQPNTAVPKVGEVREGYRYKGGDPANQSSWVALK